jgi:hypothetical protein
MDEYSTTGLLEEAVGYAVEDDVVKRVLIGGLLVSFSVLVVPIVYILGYYVDIIRETINDSDTPPVFSTEDVGVRLKRGLGAAVVSLIYSLPVLLLYVAVLVGVLGVGSLSGLTEGSIILALLITSVVGIVGSVYAAAVTPAALTLYADTGSITGAVSLSGMKDIVACKQYMVAFLLSLIILTVSGVIAVVVSFIPFVGFLFIGFIQFPVIVVSYRMFARAATQSEYNFTSTTTPTTH